jgi:DNA-binding transcriptional LysR family regulator
MQICRRLARDPRLKVLPTPVDLGTFPLEMAWHVRYRHDPAHQWLRALVSEAVQQLVQPAAGKPRVKPAKSTRKP